jgi:hypothetical protein
LPRQSFLLAGPQDQPWHRPIRLLLCQCCWVPCHKHQVRQESQHAKTIKSGHDSALIRLTCGHVDVCKEPLGKSLFSWRERKQTELTQQLAF